MYNSFFVVKLSNPYIKECEFDIDLLDKKEICLYLAKNRTNKYGENFIDLTPIKEYAIKFPVDCISKDEFYKIKTKRTFDFPTELNKAFSTANYFIKFLSYLELCEHFPNKYYFTFGNNKVQIKNNNIFVNNINYKYDDLINTMFNIVYEYEDLKLHKYNLFRRIFFR